MKIKILGIYSLIHFIVDLTCAILITNVVSSLCSSDDLFIAMIIYNFFAFAMQFPIGIIADKINKNALFSSIGCLLVAVAICFSKLRIISCIIAGLGNALFHIGGGIDILNISNKKATLSGIYVSTGALGIFLGSNSTLFNKYNPIILVSFSILILLISATLLLWLSHQKISIKNDIMIPELHINEFISIICLILTVCIRSYIGLILSFSWKNKLILALISVLAVVFGKILGGIIGDKLGFTKTSIISLTSSAIFFIFAFDSPILGILAILFFNMTMPITLTALSNVLNAKGLAFGLLTFGLFLGAIPVFLGYNKTIFTPIGLLILTLISAIVLYIGLQKYSNYSTDV